MAKKKDKDKSLTNQYIRAIENPDSVGFRNGRWYQSSNNAEGEELERPKHWNELSMLDKSDVMAAAVKNGVTTLEDIRKAWNDYADSYKEGSEDSGYRDYSDDSNDRDDSDYSDDSSYKEHQYASGGYKPSASIKSRIANWEGNSMKTNRSFETEAADFNRVIPASIRAKLNQQQLDALYSYGYNVGMGNLKVRVLPMLEQYAQGRAGAKDVANSMWASLDYNPKYRGLRNRRNIERGMFMGYAPSDMQGTMVDKAISMNLSHLPIMYFNGEVSNPLIEHPYYTAPKIELPQEEEKPKALEGIDKSLDEDTGLTNFLKLQQMMGTVGMNSNSTSNSFLGAWNSFLNGNIFANGGEKTSIYKTVDGGYTTANGHSVEQIGWDENGYAKFRDTVTGDLGKAYDPTDDYGITVSRVTNDLTPEQKADMFLKNYTLAQAVKDNQTVSNDNLWIENGREKNPNLDYKGIVGSRANAVWEQEHPAMADWMYIANATPFVVAGYPFAAGESDAVMGTAAGQAISEPLVDMATMASRSKWMPWGDALGSSYFGADAINNDVRNGNITPETVLELTPLVRAGKGIAQETAKMVQKAKSLSFNLPISYSNDNLRSIEDILSSKFNFSTNQANTINSEISKYANSKRNPIEQIRERMSDSDYAAMIRSNSDPLLSSKEGVIYFENINPLNPDTYDNALKQTENWWKTHNTPYSNLPMTEAIKHEIQLNDLPIAAAPSPFVYMQDLRSLYKRPMFSKYPDTAEKMVHQYNILKGHETAHISATPNENSPLAKILNKDDYFVKNGGTEISARGTQLKNYFDKKTISGDELKYASEHYVDDTGVDNDMTSMFNIIKKAAINNPNIWKEVAEWMTKHSPVLVTPLFINNKKN